jgi:hypothetical protein
MVEPFVTPRRSLALVLAAALLGACGDGSLVGVDASMDDAGPPGVPGTVTLLPPSTEGPGVPIDRLTLRIASLRLVGDRGPDYDPHVDDVGAVDVGDAGIGIPMGEVPPALYSAVVLDLADPGGAPVIELVLAVDDLRLEITTSAPITIDARCEDGLVVETGSAVTAQVDLALGNAVLAVVESPLPLPDATGTVHVNETTAPEAILAFRERLMIDPHSECLHDHHL